MKENTLKIGIDLFSGAGGLSIGAIGAGINVVLSIDNDIYSTETYKINHPNTQVIKQDIRTVLTNNIINSRPFIIFGGPPCQGFSYSNRKTRNLVNEANSLYEEYLRFIEELHPDWFLFENVEGIIGFNNGKTINLIKDRLLALGYKTFDKLLNASDYGVPQNRKRYILIGNNKDIEFVFPEPEKVKVSVWEAISDLPKLKNGDLINELPYSNEQNITEYQRLMRGSSNSAKQNFVSCNNEIVIERYKYIQQGQNWRAIPEHLMKNYNDKKKCHSGIYRRLVANKPSVVISNYRKNMLVHPFEDRGLSVREAARLQSFPDNFIFKGTLWYIQQQIGNAVPPLLAENIFKQILKIDR